jgi:hypothetical protein
MEFRIIGPLAVTAEDEAIGLPRPLERAVLAFLVLNVGQVVPTDRLVDELWPESPPESARHSLHVHVSRLRKALGDDVLVTRSPGYLLALDEEQIDAWRFEAGVRDGRRALRKTDPKKAARLFRQALALWRGPPLPELAHLPYGRSKSPTSKSSASRLSRNSSRRSWLWVTTPRWSRGARLRHRSGLLGVSVRHSRSVIFDQPEFRRQRWRFERSDLPGQSAQ